MLLLDFLMRCNMSAITLPRSTTLPCRDSKTISLRIHKDTFHYLKHLASTKSIEEGRYISIGDLIREVVDEIYDLPENVNDLPIEDVRKGANIKEPNIRLWTDNTVKGYFGDLFEDEFVEAMK